MSTAGDSCPAAARLQVATRFAVALDEEDYVTAAALLDGSCVYTIGESTFRGPEAIVASYRGRGDAAARTFDAITYGSDVRSGTDGWIVIVFSDHIRHGGQTLDHTCEQWIRVSADQTITRIEHHDLPGESERLAAFKENAGFAP